MAYLHNDKEQFRDAIYLAYNQTGIMVQTIEKDYYLEEKVSYDTVIGALKQVADSRIFD